MTKLATRFLENINSGITLDSALGDGEYAGILDTVTIGASVSAFQPLSLMTSSFQYQAANATSTTLMPARCLALESGSSGTISVLYFGKVRNDTWNWTYGNIYVDTSSGGLVQGDPDTLFDGTGEVCQLVGYAISADIAFFNFLGTSYEAF